MILSKVSKVKRPPFSGIRQDHGLNHLVGETEDIFFTFTPKPGEMIQFDEHIFQMG